jgi:hypothetical protein
MILGTGVGAHASGHLGGRIAVVAGIVTAASGVAVQAAFIDGSSYVPTGIGLLLFGLGAGIAMPAATELIMSTLPPERAGVGSAVNDTVREVGGALGVAVIGSIAASAYSSNLQGQVDGLPAELQAVATDNIGAALEVAGRLGADGTELAAAARDAFVTSMSSSLWAGVALATVAAVVAWARLPKHVAVAAHGHASHGHAHAGLHPVPAPMPSLDEVALATNEHP